MKANKMSKKSTIAITVMACLLAVAVATTIVLAAFSASKQATTTITFSSGVQLKVTGAVLPPNSDPDSYANAATLNWIVNVGASTDDSGEVASNGAEAVSLESITVQAKAPGSSQVYVAVKPVVTWTGGTPASGTVTNASSSATTFDSLLANGWTKGEWDTTADATGQWYLKTFTIGNNDESSVENFCSDIPIYTPTNTTADNDYASREYEATIYFEAATAAIHTGSGSGSGS